MHRVGSRLELPSGEYRFRGAEVSRIAGNQLPAISTRMRESARNRWAMASSSTRTSSGASPRRR